MRASLRVGRTLLKTLGTKSLPDLEDDKGRVAAFIAGNPPLDSASDDQLLARVFAFKSEFRHLFGRHILTSFKATAARGLLAQICDQKLDDSSLPNRLLAGIGAVESAAPSFVSGTASFSLPVSAR